MNKEDLFPVLTTQFMRVEPATGDVEKVFLYSVRTKKGIEITGQAAQFCLKLNGHSTLGLEIQNFLNETKSPEFTKADILHFLIELEEKGYLKFYETKQP